MTTDPEPVEFNPVDLPADLDRPLDPVDPVEYRRVLGRFATGIVIVTTSFAGSDHAMTVNSFASVSLDPLLVLFCCEKIARFHEVVMQAGTWGVSVLGSDQRDVAHWFATRGRPLEGQFAAIAHHRGRESGALLLDEAIGTVECRTVGTYDGGDHTIVVGDVRTVATPRTGIGPLLYIDGDYRTFHDPGDRRDRTGRPHRRH